jgi:hypothetical protein
VLDAKAKPWIIVISCALVLAVSTGEDKEQGKGIPRMESGGLRGSGVKTAEVKAAAGVRHVGEAS